MDEIKFVHLFEVKEEQIIELMNNELVGKHLPLLARRFSVENCQTFLKAKKRLWDEQGFGPLAFLVNGEFAGWGGLQLEHGDADFAMVLHPKYWGCGRKIFNIFKDQAFNQMNLNSITTLFPPSRQNSRAIVRLGFINEGQLRVDGELFMRFRLNKTQR
jgi:RimJ/RimL family protein N-acetyltransferase